MDTDKSSKGKERGEREEREEGVEARDRHQMWTQTREGKEENRGMGEAPNVDTDKRREGGEQRHERGTKDGHRQEKGRRRTET